MTFSERKATEIAAYLLKLRGGRMPYLNRMSYLKLIKLIYLADREALARWGFSITNDDYFSMPHGPVVSKIYNFIVDDSNKPYWSKYISAPLGDYEIQLLGDDCLCEKLSRAEMQLLAEIFEQFGSMTRWQLRDFTHTLPEWHDPNGSSLPIAIKDILISQFISEEEANSIIREIDETDIEDRILGVAR